MLRFALLDFIADFANWDNSTVPAYLETSRALTQAAFTSAWAKVTISFRFRKLAVRGQGRQVTEGLDEIDSWWQRPAAPQELPCPSHPRQLHQDP